MQVSFGVVDSVVVSTTGGRAWQGFADFAFQGPPPASEGFAASIGAYLLQFFSLHYHTTSTLLTFFVPFFTKPYSG